MVGSFQQYIEVYKIMIKVMIKMVVPDNHQSLLIEHFNRLQDHNTNLTSREHSICKSFSSTWLSKETSLLIK